MFLRICSPAFHFCLTQGNFTERGRRANLIIASGEIRFTGHDVVHESDYNPHDWNEESKVRPPKDIRMRVEGHDTSGNYFRTCAIFIEDFWYREDFGRVSGELCIGVERFRPWED